MREQDTEWRADESAHIKELIQGPVLRAEQLTKTLGENLDELAASGELSDEDLDERREAAQQLVEHSAKKALYEVALNEQKLKLENLRKERDRLEDFKAEMKIKNNERQFNSAMLETELELKLKAFMEDRAKRYS